MAPAQLLSSFLFTSLLLLLFISPSICYRPVNDKKVNLSLYYEALCPGYQYFITDGNGLIKLFKEDGLIDIVNLRFVPWGNAELKQNDTIVCQHGEEECYYNTIYACIIHALPDTFEHSMMIYCMEYMLKANNSGYRGSEVWRECAKALLYPQEPIQKCFESGLGKQLELAYGKETDNLYPPLEFHTMGGCQWSTSGKLYGLHLLYLQGLQGEKPTKSMP
ncbi:GILT-like protein F37H8.5 [Carica papaya]|uniref:GILT-like protein F37H8.5 n=1 Tax=Carica papaya TaxID=3649 RepID=UPI000B8CED68|nr:GILT-like protein F37H8.5 [Carica papaya]